MSISHAAPRVRTKIVATVGPACRAADQLTALIQAGADVFRLNMAHGHLEEHEETLASIREVSRQLGRPIGVLADLAGPKIRLGELPEGRVDCVQGGELRFVRGDVATQPGELVCSYERLIDELAVGDRIMLADGTVSLLVEERSASDGGLRSVSDGGLRSVSDGGLRSVSDGGLRTADFARCRVIQAGMVRSRQGVNLPGVRVGLPAMSDDDRQHAVWAARNLIDFVGLSFVRSPDEVRELKNLLRSHKSQAMVIAKIEKQEALDRLEEIVAAADGVMVARGDLGVEIDIAHTPVAQKQIVATCNRYQKPVIIATQMLDSMQHSRYPTRAEVTDVANAILDGCDACMLSGETAMGEFPQAAVEMMNRIALATEPLLRERPPRPFSDHSIEDLHRVTQAVVYGVQFIASQLDAKLVVVATHSGATALALSKLRSHVPIVAVTESEVVSRQMCLLWGVTPLEGAPTRASDQLIKFIEAWGRRERCLSPGDHILLVSGIGLVATGHNMLVVHEVAP